MDSLRLSHNVGITCADNDAGVARIGEVQTPEVAPIVGQHRPGVLSCRGDDQGVIGSPIRQSKIMSRHNIVTQLTKLRDHSE